MRLFPVGIVSATLVAAGALALHLARSRRTGLVQAATATLGGKKEETLLDRLRSQGI